jgi:TatD DNase family protein
MNLPEPDDYIDIHNHGALPCNNRFQVENLMTHEKRIPDHEKGLTYSIGIHPWFLTARNFKQQIDAVDQYADHTNVIALGESGFDRLKGPSFDLQQKSFREHVRLAEKVTKPLFIHCVRAWDDLLSEKKILKPSVPWIIHGFRGSRELARQLLSKGLTLSFWVNFVLRPESARLLKSLPIEKILLETDGSGTDIVKIYEKVAFDLEINIDQLKKQIFLNYIRLFKI